MKKVVIAVSAIVVLIAVIIWSIGAYLYVDDLRGCGQAPTTFDVCRSREGFGTATTFAEDILIF